MGDGMDDDDNGEIVRSVDPDRRDFVRRILKAGTFTVPLVATYTVSGVLLDSGEAEAQPFGFFFFS